MMNDKEEDEQQPELPSAVLMDIISRLPILTICQIRCVCKTWRNLISDPYFSKMLLTRSPFTNLHLVVPGNKNQCNLLMTEFHINFNGEYPSSMEAGTKYYNLVSGLRPIASCNGLALLTGYDYMDLITYYVSNPIMGQYMKLPFPREITMRGHRYFRGFGFCPSTNLYKVMQIHRQNDINVVEIHTLGTYTWRITQVIPQVHLEVSYPTGTYLNGALHWMVLVDSAVIISCFDFGSEQFDLISAPDSQDFCVGGFDIKDMFLGASGAHLYISKISTGKLDMWVMKDYGVKNSWTKVFSTSIPDVDHFSFQEFMECPMDERHVLEVLQWPIEVINYSNGAEIVILCGCHCERSRSVLVAYSLKAEGERMLGVERITSPYRPIVHVPSFISLPDAVTGENYQFKFGRIFQNR